jgi:hypothetical protein
MLTHSGNEWGLTPFIDPINWDSRRHHRPAVGIRNLCQSRTSNQSGRQDLNLRPLDPQGAELIGRLVNVFLLVLRTLATFASHCKRLID